MILSSGFPIWIRELAEIAKFLFNFQNRLFIFKISSFDKPRTFYFLIKILKTKLPLVEKLAMKIPKIPKIKIIVNRTNIIPTAIKIMQKYAKSHYTLEFEYPNEQGIGLGPSMEFYSICSTAISKIPHIWRIVNGAYFFPFPLTDLHKLKFLELKEIFEFLGMIISKSISDDRLFDFPLSELFWEIVLQKQMGLYDLYRLDNGIGSMMIELDKIAQEKILIDNDYKLSKQEKEAKKKQLKYKNMNIEELELYFNLPGFGDIPLGTHMKDEKVTIDNLKEYIDLVVYTTFYSSIGIQVEYFIKGFNKVFSINNLKTFYSYEIEDLVCGCSSFNWDEQTLRENIIPDRGYNQSSPQYNYLIKYMLNLSTDDKRKYLQYSTGSKRLPLGGFAMLHPKLTVVRSNTENLNADNFLPSIMT